jgi:Cu/Ag efflux protein CusF
VGEIISVDREGKKATIKHEKIEGYMAAMTMSYPIPEQVDLDKIKDGDRITATVYDSEAESRYWVGNIEVQVGEPAAK